MSKILYVEDNFQNFRLVNRMLNLERKGYEVSQAPDGLTALKMAEEILPDLILMDINLPDITGIEVTKRLKAMESFKKVPIIALTANAMVGDRERFIEAGCDGYLRKPISREELRGALREFLESREAKASKEEPDPAKLNGKAATPEVKEDENKDEPSKETNGA